MGLDSAAQRRRRVDSFGRHWRLAVGLAAGVMVTGPGAARRFAFSSGCAAAHVLPPCPRECAGCHWDRTPVLDQGPTPTWSTMDRRSDCVGGRACRRNERPSNISLRGILLLGAAHLCWLCITGTGAGLFATACISRG